ncbi:hypothetical protein R1flu_007111 [Riccia fluitans]|uniref:Cytochrome P450 n=1 Tax=Riccia fluitans TaxID=41844 RepID=A0ABD1Z219_9MARC
MSASDHWRANRVHLAKLADCPNRPRDTAAIMKSVVEAVDVHDLTVEETEFTVQRIQKVPRITPLFMDDNLVN